MSFAELRKRAADMGGALPPSMSPLMMPQGGPNKTPLPDSMVAQPADPAAGGQGGQGGEGGPATPKQAKVDVGATVMMLAKMLSVVIDKLGIDIPTGVMVQSPGDVTAFQDFMLALAQGRAPVTPSTVSEQAQAPAEAAPAHPAQPGLDMAAAQGGMDPAAFAAAALGQGQMPKAANFVEPGHSGMDANLEPRNVPLPFHGPSAQVTKLAGNAALLWGMNRGR